MAKTMGRVAMKQQTWIIADSIVSPLGSTSAENYSAIRNGQSGIQLIDRPAWNEKPFYASMFSASSPTTHSPFESIAIRSVKQALSGVTIDPDKTIFILSTTKGNIEYLASDPEHPRLSLHAAAKYIGKECGFKNITVVSNACISGVLAIVVGQRLIAAGKYTHAVIVGAEILSAFIVSGFQSLRAMSDAPCKPFDKDRAGITLGEAAACIVLSAEKEKNKDQPIMIGGGGLSNDANHISGPSRTGNELALAIGQALRASDLKAEDVDFISAHGTATLYNDEMEARAFAHAGLQKKPLHSLKGYYGHTLGAAGVLETIILAHALRNNEWIPTKGFSEQGVSVEVNVVDKLQQKSMRHVLKTASGFGGCNAAMILSKI